MRWKDKQKGFTLIEILLVVVIIGIMLAVIVPRAWRANIDTKYGLVRQNCSELASFAMEWAENQIEGADSASAATINDYLATLAGTNTADDAGGPWIGDTNDNNWNSNADDVDIDCRTLAEPESSVFKITPPDKQPRNPFNGASVYNSSNDGSGGTVIAGAIRCGAVLEDNEQWVYYALVFLGTDSTSTTDFHAAQTATTLEGLRNGVFMARVRPSVPCD